MSLYSLSDMEHENEGGTHHPTHLTVRQVRDKEERSIVFVHEGENGEVTVWVDSGAQIRSGLPEGV